MTHGATIAPALALGLAVLGLAACAPTGQPSTSPAAGNQELLRASRGVCDALRTLPTDRAAAVLAFWNEAHAALHSLAAADGLDRTTEGSVLESMGRVEYDINSGAPAERLAPDLGALLTAADTALSSLHIDPPACTGQ